MRLLRFISLAALVAVSCRANFFDTLFRHEVSVVTSTQITDHGRKVAPPSPGHPVYYIAVDVGYHDFGGIIAGDRKPTPTEMIKVIAKVLAKHGFLPATKQHPPTEVIAYAWGTMYSVTIPSPNPNLPDIQLNLAQKLKFLGGEQLGIYHRGGLDSTFDSPLGLTFNTPDQSTLISTASDDLYVAALTGYDYAEFAKHSKAVPLWKTRISCPSRGLAMNETLPTMLAIAAPYIGRETTRPVWADASDKYKPDIKLGNPVLEAYIDSGKMPVINQQTKGR